jgi:hypothetical protein
MRPKRFPDLSPEDAQTVSEWYETDPEAALEYRNHLRRESYSNRKHAAVVSFDAPLPDFDTQLYDDWCGDCGKTGRRCVCPEAAVVALRTGGYEPARLAA